MAVVRRKKKFGVKNIKIKFAVHEKRELTSKEIFEENVMPNVS